jgi:MoaA/NifB/PqqE/SkfB family radical SAM enzyme
MENLKESGVKVINHTVLLKQNANEIKAIVDKFRLKRINFPFPSSHDINDYRSVCVRLSDIDQKIRRMIYLKIPCITGMNPENNESKVTKFDPEKGLGPTMENKTKTKPERCKPCKYFDSCEGMFTLYLDLYGDSELNPIKNNALDKIACYIKR